MTTKSRVVKAGRRTYFIDLRKTKDGRDYLLITESKLINAEKNEHSRSSIFVFADSIKSFVGELTETAKSVQTDKVQPVVTK
jgi:hypothetical protein